MPTTINDQRIYGPGEAIPFNAKVPAQRALTAPTGRSSAGGAIDGLQAVEARSTVTFSSPAAGVKQGSALVKPGSEQKMTVLCGEAIPPVGNELAISFSDPAELIRRVQGSPTHWSQMAPFRLQAGPTGSTFQQGVEDLANLQQIGFDMNVAMKALDVVARGRDGVAQTIKEIGKGLPDLVSSR